MTALLLLLPAALQWCRGAVPPRVILEINRNLDLDFTFIETAQPGAAAAGLAAR